MPSGAPPKLGQRRGDKLESMADDQRAGRDRRAHSRGGRRASDVQNKPWYVKRRLWLAAASLAFVGWKRIRSLGRKQAG